jgi:hypothetical protein
VPEAKLVPAKRTDDSDDEVFQDVDRIQEEAKLKETVVNKTITKKMQ